MNKLVLLCSLVISGCAAVNPNGFYSCDAVPAGDYGDRLALSSLTQGDVNRAVRTAISAAGLTTDPRLNDQVDNCQNISGFRIYTMPTMNFVYPYDKKTKVSGFTVCELRLIVVGTPGTGQWRDSSLVHELFHAMQQCHGTPPEDSGLPSIGHDNWIRDGIYDAIDWSFKQP